MRDLRRPLVILVVLTTFAAGLWPTGAWFDRFAMASRAGAGARWPFLSLLTEGEGRLASEPAPLCQHPGAERSWTLTEDAPALADWPGFPTLTPWWPGRAARVRWLGAVDSPIAVTIRPAAESTNPDRSRAALSSRGPAVIELETSASPSDVLMEVPPPGCWTFTLRSGARYNRASLRVPVARPWGVRTLAGDRELRDPDLATALLRSLDRCCTTPPPGRAYLNARLVFARGGDDDVVPIAIAPSDGGAAGVLVVPAAFYHGDCTREGTVAARLDPEAEGLLRQRGWLDADDVGHRLAVESQPAPACKRWRSTLGGANDATAADVFIRAGLARREARRQVELERIQSEQARAEAERARLEAERRDAAVAAGGQLFSEVTATIRWEDDPAVASPIDVALPHRSHVFRFEFNGPVDRSTVTPRLGPGGYHFSPEPPPPGAEGFVGLPFEWTGPWSGRIRLPYPLPTGTQSGVIDLGAVRDASGLPLRWSGLRFELVDYRAGVWKVSTDPTSAPDRIFSVDDWLEPASIAPDGRRALFVRRTFTGFAHTSRRIPYLVDLRSGERVAHPVAEVTGPRWPDDGGPPWINESLRLAPGGGARPLPELPPIVGGGRVVAVARDPRERLIAAVVAGSARPDPPRGDLVLVDLATGAQSRHLDAVGLGFSFYFNAPTASLAWSPDGRRLAVVSQIRFSDSEPDATAAEVWLAEPGAAPPSSGRPPGWRRVAAASDGWSFRLEWSPDGRMLAVAGRGVVDLDGRVVLPGVTGSWSPDGRWLVQGVDAGRMFLWDLRTGEGRRVPIEARSRPEPVYPTFLGWSSDGYMYFGELERLPPPEARGR